MSASVKSKLVKEILNSDVNALCEILDANPNIVNFNSQCGESPLNIAIYKNNLNMVNVLLRSLADPNQQNVNGDTAFHIAARIGNFALLRVLYETGICRLPIKNNLQQTALDISLLPPLMSSIHDLQLFRGWSSNDNDDDDFHHLCEGRKLCAEYLKEKSAYDVGCQEDSALEELIVRNAKRQHDINMIRFTGGAHEKNFCSTVVLPAACDSDAWSETTAKQFAINDASHLISDLVCRTVHSTDFMHRVVNTGIHHTMISASLGEEQKENSTNRATRR